MAGDRVEIVDYDPTWPAMFSAEAERLRTVLAGEDIDAIEHFGSTAVPGLAAKPVIDILLTVPSLAEARKTFPDRLATLDYVFWRDDPRPGRLYFVKGMPPFGEKRTHHLHVCERPGKLWSQLRFRDHLRAHPEDAERYAALKRDLAARYADDREAYTEAKGDFIGAIMARIGARRDADS